MEYEQVFFRIPSFHSQWKCLFNTKVFHWKSRYSFNVPQFFYQWIRCTPGRRCFLQRRYSFTGEQWYFFYKRCSFTTKQWHFFWLRQFFIIDEFRESCSWESAKCLSWQQQVTLEFLSREETTQGLPSLTFGEWKSNIWKIRPFQLKKKQKAQCVFQWWVRDAPDNNPGSSRHRGTWTYQPYREPHTRLLHPRCQSVSQIFPTCQRLRVVHKQSAAMSSFPGKYSDTRNRILGHNQGVEHCFWKTRVCSVHDQWLVVLHWCRYNLRPQARR